MPEKTISEVRPVTRGILSDLTGCHIETIRYYERTGLMPDPPRSKGGHRLYTDDHVKRLTFIRRSRELGFSIEKIRELLHLVDGGDFTCDEIKVITIDHLADVKTKIADLRKLEKSLREMSSQCDRGAVPECPIIDVLFKETEHMSR